MNDMTDSSTLKIELSRDEALVLFELLARADANAFALADPAEQTALWRLEGALERVLPEPLLPNYLELLTRARTNLGPSSPEAVPNPGPVVYVDVDDTLVRSVGSKRIPMPSMVDHVRKLAAAGIELYCWSSGGGQYARSSAQELALEACFQGFLPKPRFMIDDQAPAEWRSFVCLHPNSAGSMEPSDYLSPPREGAG
jgi:hypothetical protein